MELKRTLDKQKVEKFNDKERFVTVIENYKSEINSQKAKVADLKVTYIRAKYA